MSEPLRSLIRAMAWLLVVAALAAPAGAQRAGRPVDCADLDPQKFEALPDEQIIACGDTARTAGELRRWLEGRGRSAMSDEDAAAAAERLETLQREVAVDTDAVRARMEAFLAQARAGATFTNSRDARRLEELRPQALELERRMQTARSAAAKERIQAEARQLVERLAVRPTRVPLVPRP